MTSKLCLTDSEDNELRVEWQDEGVFSFEVIPAAPVDSFRIEIDPAQFQALTAYGAFYVYAVQAEERQ